MRMKTGSSNSHLFNICQCLLILFHLALSFQVEVGHFHFAKIAELSGTESHLFTDIQSSRKNEVKETGKDTLDFNDPSMELPVVNLEQNSFQIIAPIEFISFISFKTPYLGSLSPPLFS